MSSNPLNPSFRYPANIAPDVAHPTVVNAVNGVTRNVVDLNQAIVALKSQVDANKTSITNVQTSIVSSGGGSIPTPPPSTIPGLGGVNNQTGNTAYTVQNTDNGVLLILSDASPIALTLNSALTTPYFLFVANEGVGVVTITPTTGTINTVASITMIQNQTFIIAFDGTNWFASITGSVTNYTTPLTAGSIVIGNDAGDIKLAPMDYGISNPFVLTTTNTAVVINGNPALGNLILEMASAATDGVAWVMVSSAGSGNEWSAEATGTTAAPFRGYLLSDITGGAIVALFTSTSAINAHISMTAGGTFSWYAGNSPVSTAIDTGLSRTGPASVAIGNGTQGDASGQAQFASHLGPTTAPTGTGPTGAWSFSQDGKISFCKAGTWEVVTTAP